MIKKLLVILIIFLFMGANVVSSINTVKNEYRSEEIPSSGNIAYAYIAYPGGSGHPEGPCYFDLDDPGTITSLASTESPYFLTVGTWIGDDRWFGVEYNTGSLWEIDPETGDMVQIGGGGTGSSGLSYNPIDERLYSVVGLYLYADDITKDGRELVCSFDGDPSYLSYIAFDIDGTLYGWDSDNLWIIDIETCEGTLVGPLGIDPTFGAYGHFDFYNDILYITTYTGSTGRLYECNEDTGVCTLVGNFEGGAEITCLAIPNTYNPPPVTNISFDPPEPDGENGWYVSNVTVILEAIAADLNATYYRINEGAWEIYESPFVLSEDGNDILIEYYSDDNAGNVEDVKSATLDIDQTPPYMTVDWTVEKVGWRKWLISFTITCTDNTSGSSIDRLEIYMNDGLQSVVTGPGPTFSWSVTIYGSFSFKFIAYDIAGNYAMVVVNSTDISYSNYFKDIFTQQSNNIWSIRFFERFPLIHRLYDIFEVN